MSVSSDSEMLHRKLEKLVARLDEDIKRLWMDIGNAEKDVVMWSKSADTNSAAVDELSALRHVVAETRKSTLDLKGNDPLTEMFKAHDIPTLRLLASFRGSIILAMLLAARESGCKISTDMEEKIELAIKDGEDIDSAVNDAIYASVSRYVTSLPQICFPF